MRQRLDVIVRDALRRGRATGAFTCYDLVTAHGVVSAASKAGEGVILLVSPSVARQPYGQDLVRALRTLADSADVPVAIQLDHARDPDLIVQTVGAGADAVLVDGSTGGHEDNLALIAATRARLAGLDVVVEAEIGRIEGDEDVAALIASASGDLTDPEEAADFARRAGVDLLAVSVGNVHGRYHGEPVIDHDRLDAIARLVDIPLVLHGASGLPAETLRRCVASGVGKININTELRRAVLADLAGSVPAALAGGANLERVLASWSDAVQRQVSQTLPELVSG